MVQAGAPAYDVGPRTRPEDAVDRADFTRLREEIARDGAVGDARSASLAGLAALEDWHEASPEHPELLSRLVGLPAANDDGAGPRQGGFTVRCTPHWRITIASLATPGARPAPAPQLAFLRRVQELEKSLRAIYRVGEDGNVGVSTPVWLFGAAPGAQQEFEHFIERLVAAAQIALAARVIDIPLASLYLDGIAADAILMRSRPLKRGFLRAMAVGLGLNFIVLWALVWLFPPWIAGVAPSMAVFEPARTLLSLSLFSGAVGAWLSFAVLVTPDSLAVLTDIAEAALSTMMRAFVILVLIFVALVMLRTGLVSITLGGFSSAELLTSKSAAILTGFALGWGQASLVKALGARLSEIITAFGAGK